MNRIDLCICTRDNGSPLGISNIPVEKLIIEKSKPIGIARQRAIARITTPIFAFIDDDVTIPQNWYRKMAAEMLDASVGACYGLNNFKFFLPVKSDQIRRELKQGERFDTNNCLIRLEAVKDWTPRNLYCYEDLDLGEHIMSKGYRIIRVPSKVVHEKTLVQYARSGLWAGRNYKEAYRPSRTKHLAKYRSLVGEPWKQLVFRGIGNYVLSAWVNSFTLLGMAEADLK
jgi:glycosyltransferase involved in cell wall biosynthesis